MSKEMIGTCMFCGQTQNVEAEDEKEANKIATETCRCDNNLKRARQNRENIDAICGESAKDFGMDIVDGDVIETLKELGSFCIFDQIAAASIRLSDSTITIKAGKDGVAVQRKKVSSVKLEA